MRFAQSISFLFLFFSLTERARPMENFGSSPRRLRPFSAHVPPARADMREREKTAARAATAIGALRFPWRFAGIYKSTDDDSSSCHPPHHPANVRRGPHPPRRTVASPALKVIVPKIYTRNLRPRVLPYYNIQSAPGAREK